MRKIFLLGKKSCCVAQMALLQDEKLRFTSQNKFHNALILFK